MHASNLDAKSPNGLEEGEEQASITAANLPAAHHKPRPRSHRRRATQRGDEGKDEQKTNPRFDSCKGKEEERRSRAYRCDVTVRRRRSAQPRRPVRCPAAVRRRARIRAAPASSVLCVREKERRQEEGERMRRRGNKDNPAPPIYLRRRRSWVHDFLRAIPVTDGD